MKRVGTGLAPLAPTNSPENAQKSSRSSVGTGLAPVRETVGHVGQADRDRPATRFRTGAVGTGLAPVLSNRQQPKNGRA